MCGIVGLLNFNKSPALSDIDRMLKSIDYRGPDSTGKYSSKHIALGINRLRIIDLRTGDQPILNEDKTVCVVFNGEIYNYKKLIKSLSKLGHVFTTKTDSEVLVHLYEQYGEKMLLHLEGMFAYAIWDKKKEQLFIARDKFGIKPLYYAMIGGSFAFGSEPKTILALQKLTKKVNSAAISSYLLLGYITGNNSAFKNIYVLPPAHSMTINSEKSIVSNYGKLIPEVIQKNITLENTLEKSVKEQLVADVPVGVFLSGGIDSSLIAYYASKHSRRKIKTFSVSFQEISFDETSYARKVSQQLNTDHKNYTFTPTDFISLYPTITSLLDEPFADPSIFPTYFLAQHARKHVTVCLSGEGGDELFGGYPTYQAYIYSRFISHIPSLLWSLLVKTLPSSSNNIPLKDKVDNFTKNKKFSFLLRHLFWTTFADTKKFSQNIPELEKILSSTFETVKIETTSQVKKLMRLDTLTYLPDDLLVKSDRASMYNSLEIRVPFLSRNVSQYAYNLPEQQLVDIFQTKKTLRQLASKYFPPAIVSREKKGFGLPLKIWFASELKELVYSELQSNTISPFMTKKRVNQILTEHYQQNIDHTRTIFKLMMLGRWMMNYGNK